MSKFDLPDKIFVSDGCSGGLSKWWKKIFKKKVPIEPCCFDHDIEYHFGSGAGSSAWDNFAERFGADWRLLTCSLKTPGIVAKLLALPVFVAVRFGGGAYWPTAYRWGFGWTKKKK